MTTLMVVLLTFSWDGEYGFSIVGVDAILWNGCGNLGQNYGLLSLLPRQFLTENSLYYPPIP